MNSFVLKAFVLTHEGKVRSNNEDNYNLFGEYKKDVCVNRTEYEAEAAEGDAVAAVYDGMGGEEAGEVSALLAAEHTEAFPIGEVPVKGPEHLKAVNEMVCDIISRLGRRTGTTAVQVFFGSGKARCVNIGDSRAYLYREGKLTQLSVDHSEGQRMIDLGLATPEAARKSANWHRLTQHIGIMPDEFVIEPHVSEEIELADRDIFLLASDGLTDMLEDVETESILEKVRDGSLRDAAYALLEAALDAGGRDNTTILLVRAEKGNE